MMNRTMTTASTSQSMANAMDFAAPSSAAFSRNRIMIEGTAVAVSFFMLAAAVALRLHPIALISLVVALGLMVIIDFSTVKHRLKAH